MSHPPRYPSVYPPPYRGGEHEKLSETDTPMEGEGTLPLRLKFCVSFHHHFPLTILPPTRIKQKAKAMRERESQTGLSTQSQGQESAPVSFSTMKISVKVETNPIPELPDLLYISFFSIVKSSQLSKYSC